MVDRTGPPAPPESLLGSQSSITGEVAGIWFMDAESGFGVIELLPDDGSEGMRCSGPVAALRAGQRVTLVGSWTDHPRYGDTFAALYWEQTTPKTADELAALLSTEAFADVGQRVVERAVAVFGNDLASVVMTEPQRLVGEAGLADADAAALQIAWRSGRVLADFLAIVEPVGWPVDAASLAHRVFGDRLFEVARDDPYALCVEAGIAFEHVDRLARRQGVAREDPIRIAAGVVASVRHLRHGQGHQHVPRSAAVDATRTMLGVDAILASAGLDDAIAHDWLATAEIDGVPIVSDPAALLTEQQLADELARLLTAHSRIAARAPKIEPSAALTSEQVRAVRSAFTQPVAVVTGGPGTGKTRAVQEVVTQSSELGLNIALCAPTGRAAKRLEELVDVPGVLATTIHRLLEARPDNEGGYHFRFGRNERLPFDLVVADEASMCDTWLAQRLAAAIDDGAHLLLVGDPDQLPSVGPGNVLADIIASGRVGVTTLTTIHRQAAESRIVQIATEIRNGTPPALRPIDGDVFLAAEREHDRMIERVVRAVTDRAPARFGVAVDDVQVLCPSYRGPVGVDRLNEALKTAINPAGSRPQVAGLHIGDRVMQTRNDADLDVANGDVGAVVDLDARLGKVNVRFPRREVAYDRKQLRDLTLAWAVTVHKAQGGEWPVIVLVVDRTHRAMLWRNLLYTAVTRAQQALIVVGDPALIAAAAKRDGPGRRWTGLAWRLANLGLSSQLTPDEAALAALTSST